MTREQLTETLAARAIEAYDAFYFSQDSPADIAVTISEKLLGTSAVFIGEDAHRTPITVQIGDAQLHYHYENETRYYWEFVGVKKVLTRIVIETTEGRRTIAIEKETRAISVSD
ncbi:MAG: hypothetical protein FWD84_05235 [Oscillospiraceae bacterium]|nr:hypothetical protein [Oscillospiraceae bacterium]